MSERLDPELAALLDAERGRTGPTAAVRERVLERVQAAVALHPPSGIAPRAGHGAPLGGRVLRWMLGAGGVVGVGAAVVVAMRAPPAPPQVQAAPAMPVSAAAPLVVPPPVAPSAAPPIVPSAPQPAARPSAVRPKEETPAGTLTAERALLDRARTDLLSGEPAAALDEVEKHARLFPRGALGEERDALRIEALVAAQRYEPARAAGARFHAAYPGSMLGPAVEGALRTIP